MKYRTTSHCPPRLTSLWPIPYALTSIFSFMKDGNDNKPSGGFFSSNSFRASQNEGRYSPSPVFCYSYKPLSLMFKKKQSTQLCILYPKVRVTFIKDALLFTPSCSNLDNPCITHSTEAITKLKHSIFKKIPESITDNKTGQNQPQVPLGSLFSHTDGIKAAPILCLNLSVSRN